MENINEIDFEIIKEFVHLPLDSLNQYLESSMEQETSLMITETAIVPATGAGVQDGAIGVDIECSGGISGHVMYFLSYDDCQKLMMLKDRNAYNSVSDDDKYEFVMDGVRVFINDIATNLAKAYRMLIECDIIIVNAEGFTVPRASEFYENTFEQDEQVVSIGCTLKSSGGQNIEFRKLISAELAKSIAEMFYNTDIKLPSQTQTLGESISDEPVESSSDSFSLGNSDMSGFINNELSMAMPDDNSDFSNDVTSAFAAGETPISEKVEHINAPQNGGNLDLIMSVPVEVSVEVGRTKKRIKEILDFKKGTLVELNRVAGEPMDIFVNGKCIAKGEVVVIEDKFGVRITKIMKTNNIFD
jgi:flagellar motor switch protein FliN/FliY